MQPLHMNPVANITIIEHHTHIENIVHSITYLIPGLCVLAFLNNGTIIGVAIASERFRRELFPSVRLLYATLAVFDIFGVVTYQFVEWLGIETYVI